MQPRKRQLLLASIVLIAPAVTACNRPPGPASSRLVPVIDLLHELPGAERSSREAEANFRIVVASLAGDARPAISVRGPSRVTWAIHIPDRAVLTAAFGLNGGGSGRRTVLAIGISDGRTYEELMARELAVGEPDSSRWHPVHIDLSAYGGWKWSLFYHPSRITWRLSLSTRPVAQRSSRTAGSPPEAVWAAPAIQVPLKVALSNR